MKRLNSILLASACAIAFALFALPSVNAQETMMGKIGDKVQKETVKVAKSTRRVGTTIGNRTWTGTKWVASKSWKGGKWVAVKTKNGTKWVYVRGRNAVRGARRPTP